jgi:hypothetical protein
MRNTNLSLNLCSCLTFTLLASACYVARTSAADAKLSGPEAKARMEAARDLVANVRSNLVLTLLELDRVRGEKDPNHPQFAAFTNQLAQMELIAAAFGKRAEEMRRKGDAYFLDWEARTAAIQNPAARQRAEKRYAERKTFYDGINKYMQEAKTNFTVFVSDLQSIKTTLEAGQDEKRIAKAKDLFMHANWRCDDVQKALMEIEDRFDRLGTSFAKDE